MIVSINATNGAGKSTVVRTILQQFGGKPLFGVLGIKSPEAYKVLITGVEKPVFILGPYRSPTGGVDLIRTADVALQLLQKYSPLGNVLFESVIISGAYGRVQKFLEKDGKNSVVAFMDTPLEVCMVNVQARKLTSSSQVHEFDPTNMTNKYKGMKTARARVLKDDIMTIIDISMQDGVETILKLLREAK